jgi:hypothetical protein
MDIAKISLTPPVSSASASSEKERMRKTYAAEKPAGAEEKIPQPSAHGLTLEEKQFFGQLFPAAAREIQLHDIYFRTGNRTEQMVGTLIDRKG